MKGVLPIPEGRCCHRRADARAAAGLRCQPHLAWLNSRSRLGWSASSRPWVSMIKAVPLGLTHVIRLPRAKINLSSGWLSRSSWRVHFDDPRPASDLKLEVGAHRTLDLGCERGHLCFQILIRADVGTGASRRFRQRIEQLGGDVVADPDLPRGARGTAWAWWRTRSGQSGHRAPMSSVRDSRPPWLVGALDRKSVV